uniref:Sushi domain-containing protein n=1 Tax=Labrus bergylta TaxID=56723 RepID=A0A3Q3ECJ3_9LABR
MDLFHILLTSLSLVLEVRCSIETDSRVSYWGVYQGQIIALDEGASYQCKIGYRETSSWARCTRDGWSPNPLCQAPKGCGRPPPLANGDTKNSAHSKYRHNDWVEYDCQHLYTMNGRPYKTCNNGEWTGQMKCLSKFLSSRISFCIKLYAPHNERITFSCTYGRRPVGSVGMHQVCNDGVIHLPSCQ